MGKMIKSVIFGIRVCGHILIHLFSQEVDRRVCRERFFLEVALGVFSLGQDSLQSAEGFLWSKKNMRSALAQRHSRQWKWNLPVGTK